MNKIILSITFISHTNFFIIFIAPTTSVSSFGRGPILNKEVYKVLTRNVKEEKSPRSTTPLLHIELRSRRNTELFLIHIRASATASQVHRDYGRPSSFLLSKRSYNLRRKVSGIHRIFLLIELDF
ncbi:hypothetical protein J6590_063902 [Homalodisca vitripennis]|nr:hypothetical protein J6590_063902 [Homalodisca vitripennis]